MKRKTITWTALAMMAIIALSALLITGCRQGTESNITVSPETADKNINPITGEPYQDIPEKRGVKTNITEFNELLRRASAVQSYRYTLKDTGLGVEDRQFLVYGRFVKIKLPDAYQHGSGEVFDEVLMDRITKTALSHCSKDTCPAPDIDKELEKVRFEEYYVRDPLEYLYELTNPEYMEEDMIGRDYAKVFKAKFEGDEAVVWLQEYYGFPLKMMVREEDGTTRTIEFQDMMIDEVRRGEIDPPFEFTVKGEEGTWWMWEHYLGEWKPQKRMVQPTVNTEPALGV